MCGHESICTCYLRTLHYILLLCFIFIISDDPPDRVKDLSIHMVTSCSFLARWFEPFSDPVCGTVQYIVIVYTRKRVISNNITNSTNYTAVGLHSNTLYEINVTAISDSGRSDPVTREVITNEIGK